MVPGRFYAFDLARALLARGHDVTVFTSYPRWAAQRFGLPPSRVVSFWQFGVLERAVARVGSGRLLQKMDGFFHELFGKWAARQVSREQWDVIHEFSGIGEELIRATKGKTRHLLARASSHIRTQAELLREEAARTGVNLKQPTAWIIEREEREYSATDYVVVLCRFAFESFVRRGVPPEKLLVLPLGVDTRAFALSEEMVERRCRRIASGEPLTVISAGQISYRKGLYDFAKIARALDGGRIRFRWIGTVLDEAKDLAAKLPTCVELMPHQPQASLPGVYAEADLFLMATIEDGFPVVLTQAFANSLPLLSSTNCSGPDIIQEGKTGWVLPARDADGFIDRLRWCDTHREELATMVRGMAREFRPRDWSDVAADFESLCAATVAA